MNETQSKKGNRNWGGRRVGAGRPRTQHKTYRRFSIALPEKYAEKFMTISEKHQLSYGRLLRRLLDMVDDDGNLI